MFAFQKQFHSLLHLQKDSHTISLLTKPEAVALTQRAKTQRTAILYSEGYETEPSRFGYNTLRSRMFY